MDGQNLAWPPPPSSRRCRARLGRRAEGVAAKSREVFLLRLPWLSAAGRAPGCCIVALGEGKENTLPPIGSPGESTCGHFRLPLAYPPLWTYNGTRHGRTRPGRADAANESGGSTRASLQPMDRWEADGNPTGTSSTTKTGCVSRSGASGHDNVGESSYYEHSASPASRCMSRPRTLVS